MVVQVHLWRTFKGRLMQLAVILLSDGRSLQVRLLYRPPSQCAIGGTADTADLGSAASACGFESLIAHHASIIQWPGSLPSKQMMRVRFPLDAPLGNSTTASASGSDPDYVCSIHTSPAIYGILVKSSRSGLEWFQHLPHKQTYEGPNPSSATIGGIAQLVEHLLCMQNVVGSTPSTSTIQVLR